MTILITGASGFIGKHLFNHLKSKHVVYGISKTSSEPNYINCNLENIDDCVSEINKNIHTTIDVIINLAYVPVNHDNLNETEVLKKNIILSKNIVLLSEKFQIRKILNFSSSSVYPNIDGSFAETSEINPSLNPDAIYGLSKFNSEMIINTLTKDKKTVVTHLRVVMVYGQGVKETRIWPVMEKELREENTITLFGSGKRLINQIHIDSLMPIVDKFIDNDYPGLYNISEETLSMEEIAKRLIKEKGNSESRMIYLEKGNTFQFKVNTDKLNSIH